MHTLRRFFVFMLFCLVFQSIYGQTLTKEEIKNLKKEIKELEKNPENYQKMKNQAADLDRQFQEKESLVTDKSYLVDELNRQIKDKDQQIDLLKRQLSDLSNTLTSSVSVEEDTLSGKFDEVYFSVQIGAYRNEKIAEALKENTNFSIEEDNSSGLKKYLIGKFGSYKEAKNLCHTLSKAGAQCFVVGFKDNERVSHLKLLPGKYF